MTRLHCVVAVLCNFLQSKLLQVSQIVTQCMQQLRHFCCSFEYVVGWLAHYYSIIFLFAFVLLFVFFFFCYAVQCACITAVCCGILCMCNIILLHLHHVSVVFKCLYVSVSRIWGKKKQILLNAECLFSVFCIEKMCERTGVSLIYNMTR